MLVGGKHMKDAKLKYLVMKSLHQHYTIMSQKSPHSCLTNDQSPAIFAPSSLPQYSIKTKLWLSKLSSDSVELTLNWCVVDCVADLMGWFTPTWKSYHIYPPSLFCKTRKMFLLIDPYENQLNRILSSSKRHTCISLKSIQTNIQTTTNIARKP